MGASVMRKLNGALLLDLIRSHGPVSRAELARLSGLTKPTVSAQIGELARRGLVVEDGAGDACPRGGKPPRPLRFNAAWGTIAAAEIDASRLRFALADLNGMELRRHEVPMPEGRQSEAVLEALDRGLRQVSSARPPRIGKLVAAAVAAPGRVDAASGAVLEAGNVFHWREVSIRGRIERALRIPVAVENDVNLAVLGEMHHGVARGARNFALIRWSTGIGAGVVLDGRLYRGSHWAAGEAGHMIFERASVDCARERGYLESVVGLDRIAERAGLPVETIASALSAALKRNDSTVVSVLDDLAIHLGMATANLAAILDPDLIVLDGELFHLLAGRIRDVVGRAIIWPLRIERSALGDDAVLLGALSVARDIAHDLISDRAPGQTKPGFHQRRNRK